MNKAYREAERRVLRLLHGHKTRTQIPQIHAHFLRHGLDQSNQVLAHFVSVCGSLDKMAYANRIFLQTHNPNIFLFNSMIKGYSLCGPFEQSLHLFSLLKSRSIRPDEYTFAPLLKSCSGLCGLKIGKCVHADIIRVGFECFGSIRIGIIEFYVTCERMDDATKVFNAMSYRDVVVWNLMIRGFCKMGNVDMGLHLFRQMTERSIVSWNSMISSLAQSGRDNEALELFGEMWQQGLEPDEATVVIVLPVCARLGAVDVGQWIHSYSGSRGLLQDVISVGNSLVDFYCKCGNLEIAWNIFNEMPAKNVVSWNVMISGLAFNGKGETGVNLFEEMINKGMSPNGATFVGALACCAHSGLVERGRELFASMTANHRIHPKLEHYGCMVDLLGRSGCVGDAHGLIRSMAMKPNAALWGALLSACRTHGDLELAELTVKELINLEPWNSGNYVLLSNIYAEEGRWEEVEKVRVLMKEKCVKKAPGQSVIK
ncbi:pentatricopeptide repeat-containing protein At1g09190 [Juglans microcarpa x Juglans regia]|uniref:pentatricopeptide repeat-containing protein At1g09190 n=1 Tax=Juglans microcarpa x Juglans regia TaxID=2249226 RepID=UPI001B7E18FA|nr:pentatricopeptide repeat-containing protein At1g09190 [Juglans microcarpa x Juglans regia]